MDYWKSKLTHQEQPNLGHCNVFFFSVRRCEILSIKTAQVSLNIAMNSYEHSILEHMMTCTADETVLGIINELKVLFLHIESLPCI